MEHIEQYDSTCRCNRRGPLESGTRASAKVSPLIGNTWVTCVCRYRYASRTRGTCRDNRRRRIPLISIDCVFFENARKRGDPSVSPTSLPPFKLDFDRRSRRGPSAVRSLKICRTPRLTIRSVDLTLFVIIGSVILLNSSYHLLSFEFSWLSSLLVWRSICLLLIQLDLEKRMIFFFFFTDTVAPSEPSINPIVVYSSNGSPKLLSFRQTFSDVTSKLSGPRPCN